MSTEKNHKQSINFTSGFLSRFFFAVSLLGFSLIGLGCLSLVDGSNGVENSQIQQQIRTTNADIQKAQFFAPNRLDLTKPAVGVPKHRNTESQPFAPNGTYINVDGNEVPSPYYAPEAPKNASALCMDGTYSFSQNRRGTCSGHGGVADWL